MRTIAIVPLLLLAFTLVGKSAHAENVLYCQTELATGFYKDDETGRWDEGNFTERRWTIKFNDDYTVLKGLAKEGEYFCEQPYQYIEPNVIICREANGATTFLFDQKSLRFVYSNISLAAFTLDGWSGYVDTDTFYAGTCEKF